MIKKAGYDGMDWVGALKARLKPRDPSADLGDQNEAEIGNALESTAQVAFNLPVKAETKHEALRRASKEIGERDAEAQRMAAANDVRTKLAALEICPIAMGVTVREPNGIQRPITKEEWEGASDARWVNNVATAAALEYEKRLSQAWQEGAVRPAQKLSSTFDPETARAGRIMSSMSSSEETSVRPSRVPTNANSILDPERLDKFVIASNSHDDSVASIREAAAARDVEVRTQYTPDEEALATDPMKSGQIMRSGGEDRDVFSQRVPRNQISMVDTLGEGKLSGEELKARLNSHFAARVEDNGVSIREANKKHRESIQREPAEQDRSWEKVSKPLSTTELMKRLADSWMPPEPGQ